MSNVPEKRPLRVAIVSPTFGGYGGMESFVLAIAEDLEATTRIVPHVVLKCAAGFVLRPELAARTLRASFVRRGGFALVRAIAAADVVHVQNVSPDAVLYARALGRPLLLTVHNRSLGRHSWRQRLWHRCLTLADRRYYVSEFVRRTWEGAESWPESRVVAPISRLPVGVLPVAQRRGFVFAARWIPNKGLETLVDAYAQAMLDPVAWPLTLVGDGPLRPEIEKRVAALGLRGVAMPGFLSQEQKAAAIRGARWMVVPPNTQEDFGLTAIEARHVEVPCIATRDGGLPEAAGDEALLCAPGDVAGLTGCLRVAALMSEAEYAARARRTRETLLPRLCGAEFYAATYRGLAEA